MVLVVRSWVSTVIPVIGVTVSSIVTASVSSIITAFVAANMWPTIAGIGTTIDVDRGAIEKGTAANAKTASAADANG
jgi:hypothetical protein